MSVDFVARALAKQQQSGQGQSFTTLATAITGAQIPAGVKIMQTSGYSAEGLGAGTYLSDSLATAAVAAAHPRFCKADTGGRYWRLLPDDNGLIPVACGGAPRLIELPVIYGPAELLSPANRGFWAPANATAAVNGDEVLLTATAGVEAIIFIEDTGFRKLSLVARAGTATDIFIFGVVGGGTKQATFNLHTGTIVNDDFGNASITALGGGYYQVEVAATWGVSSGISYSIGVTDAGDFTATVGSTAYIKSLTVSPVAGTFVWTDARPAIQDAIDYCEAIGAVGTRYDAANYALWRVSRTPGAPFDIHADKSGLLLQLNKSHRFVSTCGGTTLWRRDTDGSGMAKAKFDTHADQGYYWRGGGIFVEGQAGMTASPTDHWIYLYDMMLDGGITDSSEQNNPYGPTMQANGDGWDLSDKGIWQSNDRYCGDIVLEGRSGIRYFMGELIYSSGIGASVADRVIRVGPDVDLGHTCGSCINANGATLKVERCHLHNAYMGFEGWTGHLGGYFKPVISDCNRNTIQGGIPHFGPGSYYEKTRPVAGVTPMGHLDVVLYRAGNFEVGSWLSGRIESFDCNPSLGNLAAFSSGCQDVHLEIVTWADQASPLCAVGLLGGGPGTKSTDRVSLHITRKRTDRALAIGAYVIQDTYSYGSFGPEVSITVTTYPGVGGNPPTAPAGGIFDNAIKVTGWNANINAPGPNFNMEANNNATVDLISMGNSFQVYATNGGSYNINLPVTGIPIGYRLFIYNFSDTYVSDGAACRIPAANFRNGADLIIPHGYAHAELEFDGQLWCVVVPPPAMAASTSWDPASVAAGTSATTTVAMTGAIVGDKVAIGFSNDLQGMVLSAYVSAANSVTAVLFNPTGSTINLASGTLRARIA